MTGLVSPAETHDWAIIDMGLSHGEMLELCGMHKFEGERGWDDSTV